MSSDRNAKAVCKAPVISLVDWDMSSDRNTGVVLATIFVSLVDWDMSSDRNRAAPRDLGLRV